MSGGGGVNAVLNLRFPIITVFAGMGVFSSVCMSSTQSYSILPSNDLTTDTRICKACILHNILANYVLPRGASVTISPIVTHHCPHLYPNPEAFNPDNFSVENVAKRHKYSYIAFSGGPRGCIGECARQVKNLVKLFGDFRSFTHEIPLKYLIGGGGLKSHGNPNGSNEPV